MRGDNEQEAAVFSYISPEQRVPVAHPLRPIRQMTDEIFKQLSPRFDQLYARTGRPAGRIIQRNCRLGYLEVSATGVHRGLMIRSQTGPDLPCGDDQVRIQIVVTSSTKTTTETTWARHVGDDLYEIKGPLHLIVGLHLHDIVRAKSVSGESVPSVIEVVKRSGYKTLHILFAHDVSDEQQTRILVRLREFGAEEEAPFDRFCTIVLPPETNYETVIAYLNSEKQRGAIIYEPDVPLSTLLRSRFTSSDY